MQLCASLDLQCRLPPVVQEGGRKAETAAVLADHFGGRAGAGVEAHVEVRELGHQGAADDEA